MNLSLLAWAAVTLLLITNIGLLIGRDWRWNLGLLAGQYLAMFMLLAQYWPLGLAAVKLVTGWMSAATLGITRLGLNEEADSAENAWPQGRLFRLFASFVVIVLALAVAPVFEQMIPGIGRAVVLGGLSLFGIGLLLLGTASALLRVTIGLLTLMAGFELLYSTVEASILLTGLLALVNLGLALTGSYLMNAAKESGE
ncbi:MAG: hypothetical protein HFACDABA_01921 [Anaerolineales bacterium]|nr:hypothetical protein [Anaerolineales bacterium]